MPGCVSPLAFDPLRLSVYAPWGVAGVVVLIVSVDVPSVACGLKEGLAPGGAPETCSVIGVGAFPGGKPCKATVKVAAAPLRTNWCPGGSLVLKKGP